MAADPIQTESAVQEEAGPPALSLAVPRQGHVVSRVAEQYGAPIRAAVRLLELSLTGRHIDEHWQRLYACRVIEPTGTRGRPVAELASWHIVTAWLLGVTTKVLPATASLLDAEQWFLGAQYGPGLANCASVKTRSDAEDMLHAIADASAFADLLPYLLDPHGEGSRLSVRRRPETATVRQRKRSEGVFYTPEDVATFMAAEALRGLCEDALLLTVFDPACGTGVFLRVVLAELKQRAPGADTFDLACSCLYGTDTDPWAVDASAFVILHACFDAVKARAVAPITAWHAIRLNLAHSDALRLDQGIALAPDDLNRIARLECRTRLKSGELPAPDGDSFASGPVAFHRLFPEIAEGPRVIIGNPPYAGFGSNSTLLSLSKRFVTLQAVPRASTDMYPLFVEQMIRLTAPDAHGGAMVVPLSVACNSGKQFVALRGLMAQTPGHWRFAFFDREPHALFGEDVKTRNAIILWTRQTSETEAHISTGPLRKWRGHSRARMFASIAFTPILADIRIGIPKVEGTVQAAALARLLGEPRTLGHFVSGLGRATLENSLTSNGTTVYVGATAYNFLNVFLKPPPMNFGEDTALTEHPLLALTCATRNDALCVFALLSSRLAFWWWHVHGDGFHVSQRVIADIPIGVVFADERYARPLGAYGDALWGQVASTPIISLNRGRTSVGFSAAPYAGMRTQIDTLLIEALGLKPEVVSGLEQFTNEVTNAHVPNHSPRWNQRKQNP